jgi:hypothetical protein
MTHRAPAHERCRFHYASKPFFHLTHPPAGPYVPPESFAEFRW